MTAEPARPSLRYRCTRTSCARHFGTDVYLPADHPNKECPGCSAPLALVTPGGCPNPFCGYGGDTSGLGYCPSCCLTNAEAQQMQVVGSATPCYCGDPRDEHARGVGACLMVRDGVRCGCSRFENPRDIVPIHLLPPGDAERAAWCWPTADSAPEPLPGPDPDDGWEAPRHGTADAETVAEWGDAIVGELREGLGTGTPRPDGQLYPGHLFEIEACLMRIEAAIRRPTLLATAARTAIFAAGACLVVTFVWLLLGASTLAGVMTP